jgi:DNA repair protein RecN (Recombination protein N)
MLSSLRLRNIATISDTVLDLDGGLNVLTGETGAGKSILVDGLLLALGERADHSLVRPGARTASVDAVFVDESGSETLVRREVQQGGRSRLLIDDEQVPLDEARERMSSLVDLHTQRSSPALLLRRAQQACLDEYAGTSRTAAGVRSLFAELSSARAAMDEIRRELSGAADLREVLRHEARLIEELDPGRDEYISLMDRRRALAEAEAGLSLLGRFLEAVDGDDSGMIQGIATLRTELERGRPAHGDLIELLHQADISLREAAAVCRSRLSSAESAPWMIEQIDARLDAYGRLLNRHGGDIDRLIARREEVALQLSGIDDMDRKLDELTIREAAASSALAEAAGTLSAGRRAAAGPLCARVVEELGLMGMPEACFDVAFRDPGRERILQAGPLAVSSDGLELPEFVFSANPGIPAGPLASIASGGELSRVSLSLRLSLAGAGGTATLVFDEIDSGVGGETAALLADSLLRASASRQTVVITHLPQIAARARNHLTVEKRMEEGMPVTEVRRLEGQDRVGEIARMLGGGAAAAKHARAILLGSRP